MNELVHIHFFGQSILVRPGATAAETIVPMKPLVDELGLDWASQLRRIRRDHVLAGECQLITALSANAKRMRMSGLPLSLLDYWLCTVEASRIRSCDTRQLIEAHQRRCALALHSAMEAFR